MIKGSYKLDAVDSIDARKASIRHAAAQIAEQTEDAVEKIAFKLTAEMCCAFVDASIETEDAGLTPNELMEEILPAALASFVSSNVANTCDEKYHHVAISKVLMQTIEMAFAKKVDMSLDDPSPRKEGK